MVNENLVGIYIYDESRFAEAAGGAQPTGSQSGGAAIGEQSDGAAVRCLDTYTQTTPRGMSMCKVYNKQGHVLSYVMSCIAMSITCNIVT